MANDPFDLDQLLYGDAATEDVAPAGAAHPVDRLIFEDEPRSPELEERFAGVELDPFDYLVMDAVEPPDDRGVVEKGFSSGVNALVSIFGGAASFTGDVFNVDSLQGWGRDISREYGERAARDAQGVPVTLDQVFSSENQFDAFWRWGVFNATSGGVTALPALAVGALGAITSPLIALGAGGAFLYGMGVGDITATQLEEQDDPDLRWAAVGGVPYAVAERMFGAGARAARMLTSAQKRQLANTFLRRLGREVPFSMGSEATAEGIQTIITEGVRRLESGEPVEEVLGDVDFWRQVGEGAAAGGVAGAPFGGLGAIPGPRLPGDAPELARAGEPPVAPERPISGAPEPPLQPGDLESPLADADIARGREIIDEAAEPLERGPEVVLDPDTGLPARGSEVRATSRELPGGAIEGRVINTFNVDGEPGIAVQDAMGITHYVDQATGAQFEPIAPPQTVRQQVRQPAPELTDDDLASPIENEAIQRGQEIIEDALADTGVNTVLSSAGLPPVSTRVSVQTPRGTTLTGEITDAIQDGDEVQLVVRDEAGRSVEVPAGSTVARLPSEKEVAEQADLQRVRQERDRLEQDATSQGFTGTFQQAEINELVREGFGSFDELPRERQKPVIAAVKTQVKEAQRRHKEQERAVADEEKARVQAVKDEEAGRKFSQDVYQASQDVAPERADSFIRQILDEEGYAELGDVEPERRSGFVRSLKSAVKSEQELTKQAEQSAAEQERQRQQEVQQAEQQRAAEEKAAAQRQKEDDASLVFQQDVRTAFEEGKDLGGDFMAEAEAAVRKEMGIAPTYQVGADVARRGTYLKLFAGKVATERRRRKQEELETKAREKAVVQRQREKEVAQKARERREAEKEADEKAAREKAEREEAAAKAQEEAEAVPGREPGQTFDQWWGDTLTPAGRRKAALEAGWNESQADRIGKMTARNLGPANVEVLERTYREVAPAGDKARLIPTRTPEGGVEYRTVPVGEEAAEKKARSEVEERELDAPSTAKTGQSWTGKVWRGSGRKDQASVYNEAGAQIPLLGPGLYYAFSRREAEQFGPDIEERIVNLKEPLVINDGAQWRRISKDAGWKFPNPFGLPRKQLERHHRELREHLDTKGHDGIIVWWDDTVQGDEGPNGENLKLLRDVFGGPQLFVPEAEEKAKVEAPKRTEGYGKANKVFTEDAAEQARETLRKKLTTQLGAGVDPEILQAGITLAGYHIEAGARSFAAYSKAMIADLGEVARPYLRSWYEGVRHYPGFDAEGMTPAAELDGLEAAEGEPGAPQQPEETAEPAGKPGTAAAPVEAETAQDVQQAAQQADPEPTDAQKEAGNYAKGHLNLSGIEISIENAKGSTRRGRDADGEMWEVTMPAHYGYIRRTEGADGEQVDAYIGDNPQSERVWVVDQVDADTKAFDEHKVFIGFSSTDQVKETYDAAFSDNRGPERRKLIHPMSMDAFKDWLATRDTKKPVGEATVEAAPIAEEEAKDDGRTTGRDVADEQQPVDEEGGETVETGAADDGEAPGGGRATEPGAADGGRRDRGADVRDDKQRGRADRRARGRVEREPVAPGREGGSGSPGGSRTAGAPGRNYRITNADSLGAGGAVEKAKLNLEAIRTLKTLQAEKRLATPEEQAKLVRYVGWGGLKQVFGYSPTLREYGEELRELVTPEEFEAARATVLNAHYTSPTIIKAMWTAVERLGFKGGRVLEPGAGIGHFIGLMPDKLLGNSTVMGVEIDTTSANIARQLYQRAQIVESPYQDTTIPEGFYDLAISNVPFSDVAPADRKYNRQKLNLHDYYFRKSIRVVRPGGLVAFVTSKGTMDKAQNRARELVGEDAWLVGAIRLPDNAFEQNAGTIVTTDVIFLRRKVEGEEKPAWAKDWLETVDVAMPIQNQQATEEARLNEYFVANPNQMIGEMQLRRGRYGEALEPALVASDTDAIQKQLPKLVKKLPEGVMTERGRVIEAEPERTTIAAEGEIRQGAIHVRGGKIYQREGDRDVAWTGKVSDKALDAVQRLGTLRDNTISLIRAQLENVEADEIKALRKNLNTAYDAFVKEHGAINKVLVRSPFREDPDANRVLALEKWDAKTKTATKADIFRKNTLTPRDVPTSADSPADALTISLNQRGRVDMDYMAKLTGMSVQDLAAELRGTVFLDPQGSWQTAEEYLSGNVREKLRIAQTAAATDPRYAENVEALEAGQPEDLGPADIVPRLGASWIEGDDVAAYMAAKIGGAPESYKADFVEAGDIGKWVIQASVASPREVQTMARGRARARKTGVEATKQWGTDRKGFFDLIEDGLNGKFPTVMDRLDGGKTVVNVQATEAARAKLDEIKQDFNTWLWEDTARATRLVQRYNNQLNATVLRRFDGSHLKFPGMASDFVALGGLRKHQRDAVWRILSNPATYLAHEVGTGKTLTYIAAAMEARRLGLARKPALAVLKKNLDQIAGDFRQAYPAANLLVIDVPENAAKRRAAVAQISTGDWDAVILTHESMGKIGVSAARQIQEYNEQLGDLLSALSIAQEEGGKRDRNVREMEKVRERLKAKLDDLQKRVDKDDGFTFEDTGIDFLMVDEAQQFKNLMFHTGLGRQIRGLSPQGSGRSFELFMKSKLLHERGGRFIMGSGTPLSNSIGELFTISRYMQLDQLKALRLHYFDTWANTFGDAASVMEYMPEGGGFRQVTKFKAFVNVADLQRMVYGVMDLATADGVGIERPSIKGDKPEPVVLGMTEAQATIAAALGERAKAYRASPKDAEPDNMLVISMEGMWSSIDMRLLGSEYGEGDGSKLPAAADRLLEIYKETDHFKGTQIVFLDQRSTTRNPDFNTHEALKEILVDRGIPADEVAAIHDVDGESKTAKARQAQLFADVNSGKVRVLIATTQKGGTGVNVQERVAALHHLDVDWNFSGYIQRNGRGLRQGNLVEEKYGWKLRIFNYTTEGSVDAFKWDKVAGKARLFERIMNGDMSQRIVEDISQETVSAAEMVAITSGDPRVAEYQSLQIDIARLSTLHRAHQEAQWRVRTDIENMPKRIEGTKERSGRREANIASLEKVGSIAVKQKDGTLKEFDLAAAAEDADPKEVEKKAEQMRTTWRAAIERARAEVGKERDKSAMMAEYRGEGVTLPVRMERLNRGDGWLMSIEMPHGDFTGGGEALAPRKLALALQSEQRDLKSSQEDVERFASDLEKLKGQAGKPFPKQEELDTKNARIAELRAYFTEQEKQQNGAGTAAATDGGGEVQASIGLTANFKRSREDVIREIQAMARRMNPDVDVEIVERLFLGDEEARRASGATDDTGEVAGLFWRGAKLIQVALDTPEVDPTSTAAHELWHSLEDMLTPEEQTILREEFPAVGQLTHEEATAYAYETWYASRGVNQVGLVAAVHDIFRRIARFFRAIKHALAKRGFRTAEDIFEAAARGEIYRRGPRRGATGPGVQAAVRSTTDGGPYWSETDLAFPELAAPEDVHEAARDWILSQEKADGFEHMVLVDVESGAIEAGTVRSVNAIQFSTEEIPSLVDGKRRFVFHHNHPSGNALSIPDIKVLLHFPAIETILAHAATGDAFSTSLSTEFQALSAKEREGWGQFSDQGLREVSTRIFNAISPYVDRGDITAEQAEHAHFDILQRALHAAGVIEYRSTREPIDAEWYTKARSRAERTMNAQVTRHFPALGRVHRDSGATESLRPDRTVGEAFGLPEVAASRRRALGERDQVRGALPRDKAPPGGQGEVGESRVGYGKKRRPKRRREPILSFEDPQTQREWDIGQLGLQGQRKPVVNRVWEYVKDFGQMWVRSHRHLPRDPQFADAYAYLRSVKAAPSVATEEIVRFLHDLTRGMDQAELELFTMKALVDDLQHDVARGLEIPIFRDYDDLAREKARVDAEIAKRPELEKLVHRRRRYVNDVKRRMIAAGMLSADEASNPAYFRHQVLEYAAVSHAFGGQNKVKRPKIFRRKGTKLSINTKLVEVEAEWLFRAIVGIETMEQLDNIQERYDTAPEIRKRIRMHNRAAMDELVDREIAEVGEGGGPIQEKLQQYRRNIAIGFKMIRGDDKIETADLPAHMQDDFDRMVTGRGDGERDFQIIVWLAQNSDTQAGGGAGLVLKEVNSRRQFMRDTVGDRWINPSDLDGALYEFGIENQRTWQPDEGHVYFLAKPVPQRVMDSFIAKLAVNMGEQSGHFTNEEVAELLKMVQEQLAAGVGRGKKPQMVLPNELADTLDEMGGIKEAGWLDELTTRLIRLHKQWLLISPRSWARYNIQNISGDFDGALAAFPASINPRKYMGPAIKELWDVQVKRGEPSEAYLEAARRGVFDAGWSINEAYEAEANIGDVMALESLTKASMRKVWRFFSRSTTFRENWLRYAMYMAVKDRILAAEAKHPGAEPDVIMPMVGYGAARAVMVDATKDPRDRAALIARESIGDYGDLSVAGDYLRRRWLWFFSWQEINFKRYMRLGTNIWLTQKGFGKAQALSGLGARVGTRAALWLAFRATIFFVAVHLWNHLMFPDEEDELSQEDKWRLHIILGRDASGKVVMLRLPGALSDFLSIFGYTDVMQFIYEVQSGRGNVGKMLEDVVLAPINRIIQGVTPILKVPIEVLTGVSVFPKFYEPRPIKDPWRQIARTFKTEHEYDAILGRPSRGYGESWIEAVVARREPDESAYWFIRGRAYDWRKTVKGESGVSSASTERGRAYYYWRKALQFGDDAAAKRFRKELIELGVRRQDMVTSKRNAHPLGMLSKADRRKFLRTLTDEERKRLRRGVKWYNDVM